MSSTRLSCPVIVVLVLGLVAVAGAAGEDWPQYRGPRQDGSSLGNGLLDREPAGLAVDWRRPLGSGYSSIVVAEGQAVTMFADGGSDFAAAFDPATGEERWRYRIAETHEGHTGSSDGPLSTPVIDRGTVFGLGPRGQLFALRLADGAELWRRTLDGETDSQAPFYGFATHPVVAGGVVVVETGGPDGHSITAFDRDSGESRWSVEDDPVAYQSPALLDLAGRRQLVAVNDKYLLGIVPASGEVLWKHAHATATPEGIAQPLRLGPDRLLVNWLEEAVAFRITPRDAGFEVAELWRSNALKGAYHHPVLYDGHLYGYSGRFLTCVDAATGETVWKSRPPGGSGLTVVDGRLVILGGDGELVVAEASPAGYREKARLPVLAASATPPSFAGGFLYVRDLERMARVRITGTRTVVTAAGERQLQGELGAFVRRVEAADDKAALIEAFFASHDRLPIVEGESLVHFVYRGEVDDIALAGNFLTTFGEEVPMDRIAGTDVYFKSLALDPEAVWEYHFSVDFGKPITDPLNPLTVGTLFGRPSSELRMPRWQTPAHLAEPQGERGRIDSFQFRSDVLGNERRVRLYLPPGYAAAGERRYPLVVVPGGGALDDGLMDRALDNLIAAGRVAPLLVAFVAPAAPFEAIGPNAAGWVEMLVGELLPHLDKHYRTMTEPASRALLGALNSATAAVHVAFTAPGVFGKLAIQSPLLTPPLEEVVLSSIREGDKLPLELYLEWSRHDLAFNTVDAAASARKLLAALEARGYEVRVSEVAGAWGWSSWRAQFDDILEGFYPPLEEPSLEEP